jgi:protein-S-isoprenylcysteine O-methyltransferase Ste14
MNDRTVRVVSLTVLAVVFTVAFTFLTLEAPKAVGRLLPAFFPDYNPAIQHELVEALITQLRPVGYACVVIVVAMTILGFRRGSGRLSSLGSLAVFVPTFGYYVAAMFFLTSIGILRLLWLPFWDLSSDFAILKLGDISYIPYAAIVYPFRLLGIDIRVTLAYLTIALGLLLFFLGTVAWFVGTSEGRTTIDFGIYRYSRHPQYLGFLIWSYGVLLLATLSIFPRGGYYHRPSLPWLLSSTILICVALNEERTMTTKHGEAYRRYQRRTPFMVPLPRFLASAVRAPLRILLKKTRPETGREIAYTFLLYTGLLILLSLPFYVLNWPPGFGWFSWPFG